MGRRVRIGLRCQIGLGYTSQEFRREVCSGEMYLGVVTPKIFKGMR